MSRVSKRRKPRAYTDKTERTLFEQMVHCAEGEDTLGVIIRGHLYLESIVRTMLETELLFPIAEETFARSLPLRVRSELCVGLGLMHGEWLKPIKAVIDLRNGARYVRGRARRSRPPDEAFLRAMINVRNTTFQIPDLKPDGTKVGRSVTL